MRKVEMRRRCSRREGLLGCPVIEGRGGLAKWQPVVGRGLAVLENGSSVG